MASKWPARIAGGAAGLANGLFGGGGIKRQRRKMRKQLDGYVDEQAYN